MLQLLYQVKKLFIKGTQSTITTPWNDIVPEHEVICVALFT